MTRLDQIYIKIRVSSLIHLIYKKILFKYILYKKKSNNLLYSISKTLSIKVLQYFVRNINDSAKDQIVFSNNQETTFRHSKFEVTRHCHINPIVIIKKIISFIVKYSKLNKENKNQ